MPGNRKYKDSVFTRYFSEKPERLIELYNALEGTNYPPDTKIELNTLEDVLYNDRINDISFLLDHQLVVLVEHQSTINHNMALRMLIYLGRLYEKLLPNDTMYRRTLVQIPTPKLIVLYNGTDELPEHSQQKLSDAFMVDEDMPMVELVVDVWNVNYGKDVEVIRKCRSLEEYALFIYCVREELSNGASLEDALAAAIHRCVQNNVMREFLSQNGSEVENMLFGEWDMDKALEICKQEGFAEGIQTGIRDTLAKSVRAVCDLLSVEQLAERFQLTVSEVQQILNETSN